MGAKYIFNAAFDGGTVVNVNDLAIIGFGGIWRRFGQPHTISLQDYVDHWTKEFRYSKEMLLELAPAGKNKLVFVYPESMGECSLMIALDGRYLVVSAAVDMRNLTDRLVRDIYTELIISLRPFRPHLLITGDELDINEAMIEATLSGKTYDRALAGVELEHIFSSCPRL